MLPPPLFTLVFLVLLSPIAPQPQNCTSTQHTPSKFNKTIISEEITCRNVPQNLIIDSYHFTTKPHPQDVIITDSTISVLSNYSSLLNMGHVRKLYLKGLEIRRIVPGAFRNLKSLEELDLSHNKLTEIPDGAFAGLGNLVRLHLQANEISVDPENALRDLPKLEFLDFSENPVVIKEGDLNGRVQVKT